MNEMEPGCDDIEVGWDEEVYDGEPYCSEHEATHVANHHLRWCMVAKIYSVWFVYVYVLKVNINL